MFLAAPPGNVKHAQRILHGSRRALSGPAQPGTTYHSRPGPIFRQCLHQIAANGDYKGRATKRKMSPRKLRWFFTTETRRHGENHKSVRPSLLGFEDSPRFHEPARTQNEKVSPAIAFLCVSVTRSEEHTSELQALR